MDFLEEETFPLHNLHTRYCTRCFLHYEKGNMRGQLVTVNENIWAVTRNICAWEV